MSTRFVSPLLFRRVPSPSLFVTVGAAAILLTKSATPGIGQDSSGDRPSRSRIPSELRISDEPLHNDVRASSFQKITPGKTTRGELIEAMGDPVKSEEAGGEHILTYRLGPFPRVEMVLANGVVGSIVVHLANPATPDEVAEELGLTGFSAAPIFAPAGEQLGQIYPERGVAFSFEPESDPPTVRQLVLEPISPEFFLLRARDDSNTNYEKKIADLNYVLKVDPKNPSAMWLKARVYEAAGHYRRALANVEEALTIDPHQNEYRLLRAKLQHRRGRVKEAVAEVEIVLRKEDAELLRARAEALLGDFHATGPKHDYGTARRHHEAAVRLASPLAESPQPLTRREAKRLVLEATLDVAIDITHGRKTAKAAAPEWLRKARVLTDELVDEDGGDEATRLLLLRKALESYVGMRGLVDPNEVAQEVLNMGNELVGQTSDTLRQREIRWIMVDALVAVVRIEQLRGSSEQLVEYAKQATAILEQLAGGEESSARSNLAHGRIYFAVGSSLAIQESDHEAAVRWFERALPYLNKARPSAGSVDLVRHGQRFVSMGVSYWETGVQDEAIDLTEKGLRMMTAAVEDGSLERSPLAVPYGNLAAMYQEVGRDAEAEKLAAKAAGLQPTGESSR